MTRIASAIHAALTACAAFIGVAQAQESAPRTTQTPPSRRATLEAHLQALGGESLRVHWSGEQPTVITGLAIQAPGADAMAQAGAFLEANALLTAGATLVPLEASTRRGRTVVRLGQMYGELPVLDREATVTVDEAGQIIAFHSQAAPLQAVKRALITPEEAREAALRYVLGEGPVRPEAAAPTIRRGVAAVGNLGVEIFEVEVVRQPLAAHIVVRVDGHSGRVIGVRNRVVR